MKTLFEIGESNYILESWRVVEDGELILVQVFNKKQNKWLTMAEHVDEETAKQDCEMFAYN